MTKSEMLRSKPPVNYLGAGIIEMVVDMAKAYPEYFNPAAFKHSTCNRFVLNMWAYGYGAGPRFAARPTRKQIRVAKKEARRLPMINTEPKLNISIN